MKVVLGGASPPVVNSLRMAARILTTRGFDVELMYSGESIRRKFAQSPPDIMLLSLTLSEMFGFELLRELVERYGAAKTQYIWLSLMNSDGEPAYSWSEPTMPLISSILRPNCTEWEIVLAVEQLAFRKVTVEDELSAGDLLGFITSCIACYIKEKSGVFPGMSSFEALHHALFSDKEGDASGIKHPVPSRRYLPNSKLSKVNWTSLPKRNQILVLSEDSPMSDGTRWVAFLEGDLSSLHPRLERVTNEDWQMISHDLFE